MTTETTTEYLTFAVRVRIQHDSDKHRREVISAVRESIRGVSEGAWPDWAWEPTSVRVLK